jgi:toxin ParE1/3/4
MLPVVWAREALNDASNIADYISDHSPGAADRMVELIFSSAEKLGHHPYMYRRGRRHGTREAVIHPNYVLVYQVETNRIRIVNVLHSARQYPPE